MIWEMFESMGMGLQLGADLTPQQTDHGLPKCAPDLLAWIHEAVQQLCVSNGWLRLMQTDFGYFGPPEEHLQWTQEEREATYITPEDPSSEICGEVAAAFAASSLALKDTGTAQTSAP